MNCPFFQSYKRKCYEKFGKAIDIKSIDTCQFEKGYHECVFYKMLTQPKKQQCIYIRQCSHLAVQTLFGLPLHEIRTQCQHYCLSNTNQKNCAIYHLLKQGKQIPGGLLPNGTIIPLKAKPLM